jgi:hypothetical protein
MQWRASTSKSEQALQELKIKVTKYVNRKLLFRPIHPHTISSKQNPASLAATLA